MSMTQEVPVYAQHCAMAGQVSYAHVESGEHDDDVIWLDRERAVAWASIEPKNANDLYRWKAGRAALEYLEGEDA